MATLNLLTSASQAASGTSTPVDSSTFTVIRPIISLVTNLGLEIDVIVTLQGSSAQNGPWVDMEQRRFNQSNPGSSPDYAPPVGNYPMAAHAPWNWTRVKWSSSSSKTSAAYVLTLGVGGTNL